MRAMVTALAALVAVGAATLAAAQGVVIVGPGGGATGPAVSYVAIFSGDSQSCGTAEDQTASGYANNGNILILNTTNAFVPYAPGVAGASGISFSTNVTGIGPELGFIRAWQAKYPFARLYVIKECKAGSYQSIGPSAGTATVSLATTPPQLTVNSGSVGNNTVITGAGLTDTSGRTIYHSFSNYINAVNGSGPATVAAVSSVTATKFDGTLSWSSSQGLIYNGYAGGTDSGARYHWLAALSQLANVRIVARVVSLGTNDKANAATGNAFQAATIENIARERADLPLAAVPIIYTRASPGGTAATAVRNGIAAVATADPWVKWIDMDGQPLGADNTHWKQAALDYAGGQAFAKAGL